MSLRRFLARLMVLASLLFSSPAWSAGEETGPGRVQVAWRLLDYVAVDYPEAVRGGRIVNEAEYAEMLEFSAAAARHVSELPAHAAKADLLARSSALMAAVREKRDPQEVARLAKALGSQLLRAFPVPLAPSRTPDLTRGAAIYQEQCAACHGRTGDGKGPEAAGLDPPPIAFADRARAAQRSVFALEQVINQGLEGTEMKSFAQLSPEDRWAVAMHVSRLSFFPSEVAEGERLWSSDRSLRQRVPDLQALVSLTPVTLADELGDRSKAEAVIAFLRSHPEALQATVAGSLSLTRDRLAQSLEAYRSGHRGEARQLALSAYLDGFEPVEPTLSARDGRLMRQIEQAMARLRELIGSGAPVSDVEAQVATLDHLFAEAETILADDRGTDLSAGISSFTILLREGLEALLVVVAMIAFLRKAERTEVMPYVHAGWVAALAAGAATWLAATTLIEISGASRELTEGFGGLFAAVVLISVGIWMHGKAQAGAWQQYIAEKLDRALSRKSAWFLFMLAFVVVYREVFETILFFAAMWAPGREGAILGGALSGAVALAAIAWAMLRYSHALPIGTFFRYSSWLLAVLAVTLAGKGVAALQEAGTFGVTTLDWVPQFDVFGLYPTLEVVVAQLVAVFALVFGFRFGSRPHPRADQDRA